jgi:hypothetical protein
MTAAERRAAVQRSRIYLTQPPIVRTLIDTAIANIVHNGNAVDMLNLQRVIGSPFMAKASDVEKGEIFTLARLLPLHDVDTQSAEQGRGVTSPLAALAEMSERSLDGIPLLQTKAHDGETLGHHLFGFGQSTAALVPKHPLCRETGLDPGDILGGLLLEVNDTGRVAQGNVGTCASTSLQLGLIERRPAEYVRLVSGIAIKGQVFAANGDKLMRVPISLPPSPGNLRTVTERLFQSAILDYGNGDEKQYTVGVKNMSQEVAAIDTQPGWLIFVQALFLFPLLISALVKVTQRWQETTETNTGMFNGEIQRAGCALTGGPWDVHEGGTTGAAKLLIHEPSGRFESDMAQVSMRWSKKGEMHSFHALRLERVDPPGTTPRMVYLHNPWGSDASKKPGQPLVGEGQEPHEVVWSEPQRGIVAIPYDAFVQRLEAWTAPVPPPPAPAVMAQSFAPTTDLGF